MNFWNRSFGALGEESTRSGAPGPDFLAALRSGVVVPDASAILGPLV